MLDIRPTSEAAVAYAWFGRDCLDQARRSGHGGAKALRDGRLLVICKYTLHHATLIVIPQGDFAMHPRSGPLRAYSVTDDTTIPGVNGGGYTRSGEMVAELAARLPYPLVDDDHGTFIVSIDGEDLEVAWADQGDENYGNLWWQGLGDDPPVLSWRGPPSVQFGLPTTASISGLTRRDPAGAHTPFDCHIYVDGSRIHGPQPLPDSELATLVAGACYATDEANRQWLVAVCVTNRDSRYFLQVWRSVDKGVTWEMLAEFLSVRASSPAFISRNGRVFVYAGDRYEIDATVSSVHRGASMPTAQSGARTITGAGGYGSIYEFSGGVGYCWPGLGTDDKLVYSTYTESASFTGTGNGDVQNEVVKVPVYRGNPATEVIIRPGYFNGFVFDAEPNGAYCSIQWSGVDKYKGTKAWKSAPKGCNTSFSVSATVLPQGVTGTYIHTPEQEDMTVSGPANPYVGAQYTTSHAISPVTWSISSGAIDQTGKIMALACADPTIAATDFCGRSASLTTDLLTSPMSVSGTDTPVVGSGYSVSGAVGEVSWSISPGSINSETGIVTAVGCGSGTVTATDSCGRSASKVVRFAEGYWEQIASESFTGGSWIYKERIIGDIKYYEGLSATTNFQVVGCWVWNYYYNKCNWADNWCSEDLGYKSTWEPPKTIDDYVYDESDNSDQCHTSIVRSYYFTCFRQTYRWVCP